MAPAAMAAQNLTLSWRAAFRHHSDFVPIVMQLPDEPNPIVALKDAQAVSNCLGRLMV